MSTICHLSFLFLLQRAFEQEWECHADSAEQGLTMYRASKMMIPIMNPLAINQALNILYARSRAELVSIFDQYKYVGVSIDGMMIKSWKFLNIDIVNQISDTLPFTYDFFQDNVLDTADFVDGF
jgi:hypothetical protein